MSAPPSWHSRHAAHTSRHRLEEALNNFSALTKGDIVEISYNCLTFEILILEIKPDAESIKIIDTDLEVRPVLLSVSALR